MKKENDQSFGRLICRRVYVDICKSNFFLLSYQFSINLWRFFFIDHRIKKYLFLVFGENKKLCNAKKKFSENEFFFLIALFSLYMTAKKEILGEKQQS